MSLDISQALRAPGEEFPFSVQVDANEASRDDVAIGQASIAGKMSSADGERVTLTGTVNAQAQARCARCLCEHSVNLSAPFSQAYARGEADPDLDIEPIEGFAVELASAAVSALLLYMPLRFLCRQDCQGLCAQCGQDLNEARCSCDPMGEDSPFSALKVLLNDEKEVDPHGSTQG